MLATVKTGEAAARRDLRVKLALERITGTPQEDTYINADMKRGTELEPDALAAYEAVTGRLVTSAGFLKHLEAQAGCSPDGLIDGGAGILELKVPRSANHLEWLLAGVVPSEHKPQLMHALYVSGADYCDFASFDPRFPEGLQLFTVRMLRSPADMLAYSLTVTLFLSEVEREVENIRALAARRAS